MEHVIVRIHKCHAQNRRSSVQFNRIYGTLGTLNSGACSRDEFPRGTNFQSYSISLSQPPLDSKLSRTSLVILSLSFSLARSLARYFTRSLSLFQTLMVDRYFTLRWTYFLNDPERKSERSKERCCSWTGEYAPRRVSWIFHSWQEQELNALQETPRVLNPELFPYPNV